jgi:regulator of sigma D
MPIGGCNYKATKSKPMENATDTQPDRRTGTQDMIDKLLAERRQVLVMFCRVAGLEPYTAERPTIDLLQEFCQVLVDYSAFGHFEIYDRIASGRERRSKVVEVAQEVYGRIVEASELAVEFNDKYDDAERTPVLADLPEDLSVLGEELAMRIEMEDRIIDALLSR